MFFATALRLIPENVYRRLLKQRGNGLAAGCQLFYRKPKPGFAAMHGPHSLVRIGPDCADRA